LIADWSIWHLKAERGAAGVPAEDDPSFNGSRNLAALEVLREQISGAVATPDSDTATVVVLMFLRSHDRHRVSHDPNP
jgi:hypothetical protein